MVRNWVLSTLLVTMLAASGCITPMNTTQDDGMDAEPPAPVLMSDTVTHEESVEGPTVHPQETVVAGPWTFTAPEALQDLDVSLTWTNEQNAFRLRVTTPSGETLTRASSAKNASFSPQEAASGEYTFEAIASGVVVQDELDLRISYSWLETPDASGAKEGLITYIQEGNKWRAMVTYTTEDPDAEDLRLDVDTFNGAVEVSRTTGTAKATLKAYARADTKERAAELVQQVEVTLGIDGTRLTAHADDHSARSGSESTGASIEVLVPAKVSGSVDTSNGGITLDDLTTTGLTVDTSNGPISGKLTSSGDLVVDTSNGGIDLHIVPTKSHALDVDTSNGGIDLTLDEGADKGYRLDADTSNGRISEDMDEAELSGEDDTDKRLETSGYSGRAIQVSGTVDTSNGNIRFEGA